MDITEFLFSHEDWACTHSDSESFQSMTSEATSTRPSSASSNRPTTSSSVRRYASTESSSRRLSSSASLSTRDSSGAQTPPTSTYASSILSTSSSTRSRNHTNSNTQRPLPHHASKKKPLDLDSLLSIPESSENWSLLGSLFAATKPELKPSLWPPPGALPIGKLDDTSVSVEVELSIEAARKAAKSIWWVPRH